MIIESIQPEYKFEEKIEFKDSSNEELVLDVLSSLYLFEKNTETEIQVYLKNLSLEVKIAVISHALKCDYLTNSTVILNIFNLIKGYNTFEDSFFESEHVFFNNLEEFLDCKIMLNRELSEFSKKLIIFYISILKSCGAEQTMEFVELPLVYKRILYISDFISLSNIFSKIPEFNTEELVYVLNSYDYVQMLANKLSLANNLMEMLLNGYSIESTNNV